MIKLIEWLSSHRLGALILVMLYFSVVIFPHEWVGVNINAAFSSMPRGSYDLIILILCLILLLFLALFFRKKLLVHPQKKGLLLYFGLTLFFIFLVNSFLFVINIESVHYVQYGIGAILLFGLIGHYYSVLFIAFLVAIFDEGYQYFYLSPHRTDYFDMNDIITDFLGAAFGLLLLKTLSVKEWGNGERKMKNGFYIPLIIFVLAVMISLSTTLLSIFPSNDKFMLVRNLQDGFWTTVPPEVTFHVTGPIEGTLILIGLFIVYYVPFRSTNQI